MKILLTGIAGFIGSHLARRLIDRGDELIGLDNFDETLYPAALHRAQPGAPSARALRFVEGDLLDAPLIERLIAETPPTWWCTWRRWPACARRWSSPSATSASTSRARSTCSRPAAPTASSALVFASSSSVYGARIAKCPSARTIRPIRPASPYAATKRAGELFCSNYSDLYGIATTALRFFTVYGPRQRPEMAIHKFARLIRQASRCRSSATARPRATTPSSTTSSTAWWRRSIAAQPAARTASTTWAARARRRWRGSSSCWKPAWAKRRPRSPARSAGRRAHHLRRRHARAGRARLRAQDSDRGWHRALLRVVQRSSPHEPSPTIRSCSRSRASPSTTTASPSASAAPLIPFDAILHIEIGDDLRRAATTEVAAWREQRAVAPLITDDRMHDPVLIEIGVRASSTDGEPPDVRRHAALRLRVAPASPKPPPRVCRPRRVL